MDSSPAKRTRSQWLFQALRTLVLIPGFIFIVSSGIDMLWVGVACAALAAALYIWPFGERRIGPN